MMEYKVISSYRLESLVKEVNQWLQKGWKLQGGIGAADDGPWIYMQAMVREMTSDI